MYDVSDIQIYKNLSQNKKQNLQFLLFQSMHVKQKKQQQKQKTKQILVRQCLRLYLIMQIITIFYSCILWPNVIQLICGRNIRTIASSSWSSCHLSANQSFSRVKQIDR